MLEIRNAVKEYTQPDGKTLCAVKVEQLTIEKGSQWVLAGASGSGKTTLLHVIAGFMPLSAGEVYWEGIRIDTLSQGERDTWRASQVGYIFQNLNLLSGLTVLENLEAAVYFSRRNKQAMGKKEMLGWLERVGLADRAQDKPGQLSMGEQQRVAVVRALLHQPALILADEPTASLDRDNVKRVLALLRELCREKQSILVMATHDQDVIGQFSLVHRMERAGGVTG